MPEFAYQAGEKVLCFHGPLLYEAKCLQLQYKDMDTVEYRVHYSGWNKSWDEWVEEKRILKHNQTNVEIQKSLHKQYKKEMKSKKGKRRSTSGKEAPGNDDASDSRGSTPVDNKLLLCRLSSSGTPSSSQESSSDTPPRRKKAKVDSTIETEEHFLSKVEIRIKLPYDLKPILVEDWELVSTQKRLLIIPSKHTVDSILDDYSRQRQSSKPVANYNKEVAKLELTVGLREYFNIMLGSQLLYKPERKQYSEIVKAYADLPLTQLYGAIHLLRLFVKIGGALTYTRLDEKMVQLLVFHIQDFLKFLYRNKATYFSIQDYAAPLP